MKEIKEEIKKQGIFNFISWIIFISSLILIAKFIAVMGLIQLVTLGYLFPENKELVSLLGKAGYMWITYIGVAVFSGLAYYITKKTNKK